tara:strand:- start:565 stop:717 length:153 start_codon:yes stop_codon:yes gene_type:complete
MNEAAKYYAKVFEARADAHAYQIDVRRHQIATLKAHGVGYSDGQLCAGLR